MLRVLVWSTFLVVLGTRTAMWLSGWEAGRGQGFGPFGQFQGFDGPRGGPRMMRRRPARLPEGKATVENLPTNLWRLNIEVSSADARKLQGHFWNGWNGGGGGGAGDRPEARVRVTEGETVYTNVALHLKGSAGSFRPFDDKPAMTLNFSKYAKGQSFHGLTKLSLNNSVQDETYLTEALCREMFVASGVPAPRAEHATVVLNGRDLGLYVLVEGWGKPFLKRFFPDASGNLYDGGFLREVTDPLEATSGDQPEDRADLNRLAAAASVGDTAKRWKALNEVLDVDRFLSLLAMEVMTCHWDGYALNRNNYRVFHDRSTDRMVFMPHGLDQMFGINRSSPTSPILPSMHGLVARAVIGTPEGRRRYLERVAMLSTNVFVEAALTNRVRELNARIRPTLEAYSPDWAAGHDREVEYLCQRISERARSIAEQLQVPSRAVEFDAQGNAKLSGWAPRAGDRGAIGFEKAEREGVRVLVGKVMQGGAQASWRTHAELTEGRYRFEGRVRTVGMGAGGGVCLRISGQRRGWVATKEGEWRTLTFPLEIDEGTADVELVCEFGGSGGEAWFDEASLRVVRLPE